MTKFISVKVFRGTISEDKKTWTIRRATWCMFPCSHRRRRTR